MKALSGRFLVLAGTYLEKSTKPPSLKARLQAAPGTHTDPNYDPNTDPHVSGLALDIILFASVPLEKSLAENLVDVFVAHKDQMKWSAVIYNWATTDDFGGPKPYTGRNKHETHIHIQWAGFTRQHRRLHLGDRRRSRRTRRRLEQRRPVPE
jgi:hypothetical protein